ncbi:GNAT family N-acetyltransferase [Corynebacterium kroppenstedtii]|uniref:GNAT family N-acetyltransferase n=1 Tax=Corynebacterium sp. PCR 32 TaxID=3351342 RepID=UPI003098C4D0
MKEAHELQGHNVVLTPLSLEHEEGLISAVEDGKLWEHWYTKVPSPDTMKQAIIGHLDTTSPTPKQMYTVCDMSGKILGMTGFQSIDSENRRMQIGYTWYRKSVHNSFVNSECKLLLLDYAFSECSALSVFFTTNSFNHKSRRALESIGAHLDGIIRNHQILPNGLVRDTCLYSILVNEWPAVKHHLQYKIEQKSVTHDGQEK